MGPLDELDEIVGKMHFAVIHRVKDVVRGVSPTKLKVKYKTIMSLDGQRTLSNGSKYFQIFLLTGRLDYLHMQLLLE